MCIRDGAIAATAARKGNAGIKTVEDMIPKMDPSHYPNRRYLDLQYADISDDAKLDIFLPDEGDGPFPVFIEVHGGGWYFGQKRSIEFEPFLLGLKRGYAVVSMGYTLSPKARYPQAIEEIKAGIRFLKANAEKYHLDPNRIAMWGGSDVYKRQVDIDADSTRIITIPIKRSGRDWSIVGTTLSNPPAGVSPLTKRRPNPPIK